MGGTAGITVAARLRRARRGLDVAVLEPESSHYYQPLWTLVGAGVAAKEASRRDEAGLIPPGAKWIQDRPSRFDPDQPRDDRRRRRGRLRLPGGGPGSSSTGTP